LIAVIYWDATNKESIILQNEKHGRVMDSMTHLYLHETVGARYETGLLIDDITIGNGSSDNHRQFSVGSGSTFDEDLINEFDGLSFPAQIPILYMDGAAGIWRMKSKDTFPYIQSGSDVWTDGSGRPAYNKLTTGTWSLAYVAQNSYFCVHYFCEPGINDKIYGIVGQVVYGSSSSAKNGAPDELLSILTIGLPTKEWTAIGTVLFQSKNSNAVSIVQPSTGVDYIDWRRSPYQSFLVTATATPSANQILTSTTNFNGNLSTADTTVQAALDTLDNLEIPVGDWVDITDLYDEIGEGFTIVLTDDVPAITIGTPIRITWTDTTVSCAIVGSISSDELSLTCNGFVGTTATKIEYGKPNLVQQVDFFIPGNYNAAASTNLLKDINTSFTWKSGKAELIAASAYNELADTTAEPLLDIKINTSAKISDMEPGDEAWSYYHSVSAISPIFLNDEIKVVLDTNSGDENAEDLTVSLVFVYNDLLETPIPMLDTAADLSPMGPAAKSLMAAEGAANGWDSVSYDVAFASDLIGTYAHCPAYTEFGFVITMDNFNDTWNITVPGDYIVSVAYSISSTLVGALNLYFYLYDNSSSVGSCTIDLASAGVGYHIVTGTMTCTGETGIYAGCELAAEPDDSTKIKYYGATVTPA
jgi:hypothetical protein